MAQPRPEVAVASVCLIAVLYNYEQWRERERHGEKPGEGQKPTECHVKCTPLKLEREGSIETGRERERETESESKRQSGEERNETHLSRVSETMRVRWSEMEGKARGMENNEDDHDESRMAYGCQPP